jgi:hypothetical protein
MTSFLGVTSVSRQAYVLTRVPKASQQIIVMTEFADAKHPGLAIRVAPAPDGKKTWSLLNHAIER